MVFIIYVLLIHEDEIYIFLVYKSNGFIHFAMTTFSLVDSLSWKINFSDAR